MGVVLIDIGHSTTSLAVFEDGDLIHIAIFPLGSNSITNDIAIGLKIEVSVAEDIKKQYGTCMLDKLKPEQAKKKIEFLNKSQNIYFTKKQLVDIIEPRVSEILDVMQRELKKIGNQEMLPEALVLTGGGAKFP